MVVLVRVFSRHLHARLVHSFANSTNRRFARTTTANDSFRNLSKMASQENATIIGVLQLNCTYEIERNWETINRLIRQCKLCAPNVKLMFLPEGFDYIGRNKEETVRNAFSESDEYIGRYRSLAKELNVWFSLGGFHEKANEHNIYNTHLVIDDQGKTAAKYRKLHLFDIDIPGKVRVKETDFTIPGDRIVQPVHTPCGNIGLSTCYDLRFPHLASILRNSGAHILTYPSAFTVTSGMDHWEILLRARAITSQCYVVAAAQTGRHNEKRSSFGHAMVVDPWGAIIAQCSEGQNFCVAQIDLDYLAQVRQNLPCSNHRRLDLYDAPGLDPNFIDPINSLTPPTFTFGQVSVPRDHVFLLSRFSYAFVNIKPVLPGHVLVCPLRPVEKFTDLTEVEIADLMKCVRTVEDKLEKFYKVTSTSICIQDGPDAGQSIKHVHVHVIPRRSGDFGDEIYKIIEKHDKDLTGRRTPEEMAKEAQEFRQLFF